MTTQKCLVMPFPVYKVGICVDLRTVPLFTATSVDARHCLLLQKPGYRKVTVTG